MNLKFILSFGIVLSFVIISFSCSFYGNEKLEKGKEIVKKIENFKNDKGKLPESLAEIGIEEREEGPIYYKKESETKFMLWFGTTLGESVQYNSDTKQWK